MELFVSFNQLYIDLMVSFGKLNPISNKYEITMTQFKTLATGTNHTSLIICDGELKVVQCGEVIAVITNW